MEMNRPFLIINNYYYSNSCRVPGLLFCPAIDHVIAHPIALLLTMLRCAHLWCTRLAFYTGWNRRPWRLWNQTHQRGTGTGWTPSWTGWPAYCHSPKRSPLAWISSQYYASVSATCGPRTSLLVSISASFYLCVEVCSGVWRWCSGVWRRVEVL